MSTPSTPVVRRSLFLDESLTGAPTDTTGPVARLGADGTLYVLQAGAYVAKSGPGAGGAGGGVGLLTGSGRPTSGDGQDGDFYIQVTEDRAVFFFGPKASGDWPLFGARLEGAGVVAQNVDSDYTLTADGFTAQVYELTGAAAKTITVPSAGEYDDFTQPVWQLDNVGTGAVTIAPASGATLNGATTALTMAARYSSVVIRRLATGSGNDFIVVGQFS